MKLLTFFSTMVATAGLATAATITAGVVGTAAGVNNWPGGEPPTAAIDGFGQKYLNFGKENTGVLVTPASTAVPTSLTLWAANDSTPRDPASYQIFGTNEDVSGGGPYNSSIFTMISSGAVSLPDSRNLGGAEALLAENSFSSAFTNGTAYSSYLILFPTLKDSGAANSMQIAEIQLFADADGIFAPGDTILGVQADGAIPEPSTALLGLLGFLPVLRRRR